MSTEFKWTDQLVLEYAGTILHGTMCGLDAIQKGEKMPPIISMNDFKASKQPKREWEIVAYQHKDGELIERSKDSWQWIYANNGKQDYQIYSVKRLSDGEVFAVGDICVGMQPYDDYPKKPIKRFFLEHEELMAQFDEGHGSNDGCLGIMGVRRYKEPLFTTEDSVPVCEGDTVYMLSVTNWSAAELTVVINGFNWNNGQFKYFSTKEKAEEYKLFNAPLLSLEEIKRHGGNINYDNPYFKTLIQKAKDKLNLK